MATESKRYSHRFQVACNQTNTVIADHVDHDTAERVAWDACRKTGDDYTIWERRNYPSGLRSYQVCYAANHR